MVPSWVCVSLKTFGGNHWPRLKELTVLKILSCKKKHKMPFGEYAMGIVYKIPLTCGVFVLTR